MILLSTQNKCLNWWIRSYFLCAFSFFYPGLWITSSHWRETTVLEDLERNGIWAVAWDFQQFGMCDQQRLRPACAYAQTDQSLCWSLRYSMTVKLLTDPHLRFLSLKGGCTGSCESVKLLEISCRGSYESSPDEKWSDISLWCEFREHVLDVNLWKL